MNIQSANVVITSAGSTLGETLAAHFCELGANIILCDQSLPRLTSSYERCQSISDRVNYYHMQDYSRSAIDDLFDFVNETFDSSPDVLVNNWPGCPVPKLMGNASPDLFTQAMAVMASTLFTFGQATAERMRTDNKKGVIVNVVSMEACQDLSGFENVTSMIAGFTQSWARELTPFNIRVGGVVPALRPTSNGQHFHWAQFQDELIRNTEYIVSNEYFSGRVMSAEL
ncbi:SDR family oxidoreductase [Vibrio sp. S4M6]|uniref:SDR family oxidoreductase n=1 Tax=Vibrio sinus TaxID=2946865 RepID=UPI00202AC0BE|nr:SDR family oxidoreductase [Vibrio sinus]MCL9782643.1 SDR family oxidoreductase [Vibrio sinus]